MSTAFSELFQPFSGTWGIITALIAIVVGLIFLLFGRRLYWLFVGVAGFLLGLVLGPALLGGLDPQWQPLVTLLIAIMFTILSIVLNKLMITLSGGIGLGVLGFLLAQNYLPQWAAITIAIIAGILGLLIAWFIFDWGLMIFSALAGSALVVSGILTFVPNLDRRDIIIFIVLFVIGLGFQIFNWSREHHEETETTVVREGVVVVDEDEIHDDDVYDDDDDVYDSDDLT
jgi:MFS family permease